jgi:PAS domain S-box-containing protein
MNCFIMPLIDSAFMPHGHCYFWDPFILWSHALSDSIIALAYFAIPFSLVRIVRKRKDFHYMWVVTLFAIFILGCGATHLMDVIVIWKPWYYTDSIFRIITALASIGTAIMLIFITPQLILIPSAEKWKKMNEDLRLLNESLEEKVQQRTKALAESAASLEFVTDTIPQIVWTSPPNGKLDYYNQNWYVYTQLSHEESIAFGWQKVLHPEDIELVTEQWTHAFTTGEKFETEFRLRNGKTGEYRWHLGRALAMKDENGDITKWFGTATDVHDQRQKSEELKKVNEELDNFVYTASHDLKAPLSNLEGLVNLIEDKAGNHETYVDTDLTKMMHKQVYKLKMIVNDLADVGRIEKEVQEDFEKVRVDLLVEDFKLMNQERMKKLGAVIDTSLDSNEIIFSRRHLRSIIHNLLDNALKYSRPGEQPIISLETSRKLDYWQLSVTDNGIGIQSEFHERVFDMFKRYNRTSEGTGIGLYIIKRVAEKYGGTVKVDSTPDQGSTFIVRIPLSVMKESSVRS